jgi:hypothetical protein
MRKLGLYINKDVFSHGQLYVALSRCGNPDDITIMVKNGFEQSSGRVYTLNIVYKEILRKRDRDREDARDTSEATMAVVEED